MALEIFDGTSWISLVPGNAITLTGDVTGSGQGSVATTLNPQINKSGNQVFNFSGTPDAFNVDLTIPNSTNKTVKLRFNRLKTGLGAGYEFQFYAPTNGVDTFTFGYNSGGQFGAYYTISNNAKVITFTSFRLAGLVEPVSATDGATKNYVDQKFLGRCMLSSLNTAIKVPNSTFTALTFDGTYQTTYDPSSWHSNSTNPTHITPGVVGTYRLTGAIRFVDSTSGTNCGIELTVNGKVINGYQAFAAKDNTQTGRRAITFSCIIATSATTDYFEMKAYQDTGSSLGLQGFHFQVEQLV
jgi:hypothetical protein